MRAAAARAGDGLSGDARTSDLPLPEALDQWLAHLEALHPRGVAGIELGLERVALVANRLGQQATVPVITVGGTNGKGSTCAMLERMLASAGYRVGLYTSPHLLTYNERVRVGGHAMDAEQLCQSFSRVEAARKSIPLTYFEFGTLAAWECFVAAGVDAIVLEVGLGGRLDAVNIYASDCAIVTSVDIDHTDFLGNTREAIGFEKAGIFRSGKTAICADADPPQTLVDHAGAIGADLRLIGRDFGYERQGGQWQFWTTKGGSVAYRCQFDYPAMRGNAQLRNASAALAALETLQNCLPVALEDVRRGLLEADLPGRFQIVNGPPMVILDVAHNPQAASVLSENLRSLNCHGRIHPSTWAVFGMLRDKDVAAVAKVLAEHVTEWLPCSLSGSRASTAAELRAILAGAGIGTSQAFDSPLAAFQHARERAGDDDRIVVFGSFQTVAEILRELA